MTALACTACSAPLIESELTKCEHCGAELAAGDQAWVLDAVLTPEQVSLRRRSLAGGSLDATAAPLVPDVSDPRERRILFARMAQLMAADDVIEPRERRLLETCAARWAIPADQVRAVLASPPRGDYVGTLDARSPEWFLAGLVAAAMADGRVDARERALIERACDALGLPRDAIDRQIAKTAVTMQAAAAREG